MQTSNPPGIQTPPTSSPLALISSGPSCAQNIMGLSGLGHGKAGAPPILSPAPAPFCNQTDHQHHHQRSAKGHTHAPQPTISRRLGFAGHTRRPQPTCSCSRTCKLP